MFKKIPYGVKVRVRGDEELGYIAEYAIGCFRFFPFLDDWTVIKYRQWYNTFPTFELAKKAAMDKYNSWMRFYGSENQSKEYQKKMNKSNTIWDHP